MTNDEIRFAEEQATNVIKTLLGDGFSRQRGDDEEIDLTAEKDLADRLAFELRCEGHTDVKVLELDSGGEPGFYVRHTRTLPCGAGRVVVTSFVEKVS